MAKPKRLTDTEKWDNPRFRALPVEAKLAWFYLWEHCDHAGLIIMDYDAASFHLGFELTEEKLKDWFGGDLFPIAKRLLFPNFLVCQYGLRLEGKNKCLESAKKIHSELNIQFDSLPEPLARGSTRVSIDFPNPSPTPTPTPTKTESEPYSETESKKEPRPAHTRLKGLSVERIAANRAHLDAALQEFRKETPNAKE